MSHHQHLLDELACIEAMVASLARLQGTFDGMTRRQCTSSLRVVQEAAVVSALIGADGDEAMAGARHEVERLSGGLKGLKTANQQLAVLQSKLVDLPDHRESPGTLIDTLYRAVVQVTATGILSTAQTDVALRELDVAAILAVAEQCVGTTEESHE